MKTRVTRREPEPPPEPGRPNVSFEEERRMIEEMEAGALRVRRVDNGVQFRAILVVPQRLVISGENLIDERQVDYKMCVASLYHAWVAAGKPTGGDG